jgi:hypothetical protein
MPTKEYVFTPFTVSEQQRAADKLRHEAKTIMLRMFGIPEGGSAGQVERMVDCMIGCAIYEVAEIQRLATNNGYTDLTPGSGRIKL